MQEMLLLADSGVPWDVASKWSRTRRFAACVAITERRSRETYGLIPARFDWSASRYVDAEA
ncbi:hypothetical protein [Komagataeibacter diospyri]|uniref:Transposase n=1 Tax=Komagataeibacter diospyri TaxID=1932662 RepID=A0A4P5NU57_9PROT|nr:hypothetical protein [Komagataeibacter diospyri]GCE85163.1 hypothetical protein MSKU9_3304 [Komagataeibacter diospyri]